MTIILEIPVEVEDLAALNAWVRGLGCLPRRAPLEERIYAAVVNPETAPEETGYTLLEGCGCRPAGDGRWIVRIMAEVAEPHALVAEARERMETCFFDSEWRPETLAEALYEVLIASNASPSPEDIGVAILSGEEFILDAPAPAAARARRMAAAAPPRRP